MGTREGVGEMGMGMEIGFGAGYTLLPQMRVSAALGRLWVCGIDTAAYDCVGVAYFTDLMKPATAVPSP